MSLLRLLTTGKSLVGIRDSETRYRLTRQRFVPRFGPAENPFCATAKTGSAQPDKGTAAGEPSPLRREKPTNASCGLVPAVLVGSQRRQFAGMLRSRATALRQAWAGRLAALFFRSRGKAAAVGVLRTTRLPVQGELLLDRIKVVRNDLSDADLEVIPASRASGRVAAASAVRGTEDAMVGNRAWGRVSGFFRAGKT